MRRRCFSSRSSQAARNRDPGSVSFAVDAAPAAAKRRTGMVRGVYEPPEDPKYQPIYEQLRNDMALERFAEVLRAIRLAKPLVFKFAGCDATVNAWYEPPMAR